MVSYRLIEQKNFFNPLPQFLLIKMDTVLNWGWKSFTGLAPPLLYQFASDFDGQTLGPATRPHDEATPTLTHY